MTIKIDTYGPFTINATGAGAATTIPFLNAAASTVTAALQGTFGGTSAQLQGSLDGTNWFNLGSPLTAAGQVSATQLVRQVRWFLTGGTGINLTTVYAA